MIKAVTFLLFILKLSTTEGQNKIIVFDKSFNVLFSKSTNKLEDLNKISFAKMKKEEYKENAQVFVYFGSVNFKLSSLKQTCNSIYSIDCSHNQKMNLLHIPNLDTFCYQSGINHLPDGKWLHGSINQNKFKVYESYTVKNNKYEGFVISNSKQIFTFYKNGYIRSNFFSNDSILDYKHFDSCGILYEAISLVKDRVASYFSASSGIMVNYWTNDSIKSICNVYKGLEHGLCLSFSKNGQCENLEKYIFGKREYRKVYNPNDKTLFNNFMTKLNKIEYRSILNRLLIDIERDFSAIGSL